MKLGVIASDEAHAVYHEKFHKEFCNMTESRLKERYLSRHKEGSAINYFDRKHELQQNKLNLKKIKDNQLQI